MHAFGVEKREDDQAAQENAQLLSINSAAPRRRQLPAWTSSRCAAIAAAVVVAVLVVCLMVLVRVGTSDGAWPGSHERQANGSSVNATPIPEACQAMARGAFWEYAVPEAYDLALTLPPPLFDATALPPATVEAQANVTLRLLRASPCLALHSQNLVVSRLDVYRACGQEDAEDEAEMRPLPPLPSPSHCTPRLLRTLCADVQSCAGEWLAASPDVRAQLSVLDRDLVLVFVGDLGLQRAARVTLSVTYAAPLDSRSGEGLHLSAPFCAEGAEGATARVGGSGTVQHAPFAPGQSPRPPPPPAPPPAPPELLPCRPQRLVASQLEPTMARRLFPCYDGPEFKAVFRAAVRVPRGAVVLFNTRGRVVDERVENEAGFEDITNPDAAMVEHLSEPSLPMSPYLWALAAGALVKVPPLGAQEEEDARRGRRLSMAEGEEAEATSPVVETWAVPSSASRAALSALIFELALEHHAAWTRVMQPLGLMQAVAVPGKGGAMENWGLLQFDEARFLWDGSAEGAWRAADVVCHEAAHQWLGNLVTAAGWRQLAFNEGLASWAEYACVHEVLPFFPVQAALYRAPEILPWAPGVHEGPVSLAKRRCADPLSPSIVPASDLDLAFGVTLYSKSATLLDAVDQFLSAGFSSRDNSTVLQQALTSVLHARALETASLVDVFAAMAATLRISGQVLSPAAAALVQQMESLNASTAARAPSPEGGAWERATPLGLLLHAPSLPLVAAYGQAWEAAQAQSAGGGAETPTLGFRESQSLLPTDRHACAWRLGADLLASASPSDADAALALRKRACGCAVDALGQPDGVCREGAWATPGAAEYAVPVLLRAAQGCVPGSAPPAGAVAHWGGRGLFRLSFGGEPGSLGRALGPALAQAPCAPEAALAAAALLDDAVAEALSGDLSGASRLDLAEVLSAMEAAAGAIALEPALLDAAAGPARGAALARMEAAQALWEGLADAGEALAARAGQAPGGGGCAAVLRAWPGRAVWGQGSNLAWLLRALEDLREGLPRAPALAPGRERLALASRASAGQLAAGGALARAGSARLDAALCGALPRTRAWAWRLDLAEARLRERGGGGEEGDEVVDLGPFAGRVFLSDVRAAHDPDRRRPADLPRDLAAAALAAAAARPSADCWGSAGEEAAFLARRSLQRCWVLEPDDAAARQCLRALASAPGWGPEDVAWVLRGAGVEEGGGVEQATVSADALPSAASPSSSASPSPLAPPDSPADAARRGDWALRARVVAARRARELAGSWQTLVARAAAADPGALLPALLVRWLGRADDAPLCGLLEALQPEAWAMGGSDPGLAALQGLALGGRSACPAELRLATWARAAAAAREAPRIASQLCLWAARQV